MPARVVNSGGNKNPEKIKAPQVEAKAPVKNIQNAPEIKISAPVQQIKTDVQKEMEAVLSHGTRSLTNVDRAQFYAGHDRLSLQGSSVQRVRELQEENDHLQREIAQKESEIAAGSDPLAILADIEHRKVIIARNTGEILKIYLRNEERMKRIKELETQNVRIQSEMMEMQGQFIATKNMDEKTKFASEFFIMKSQIERNLTEINELNQK